jgi:hypothetical protein
LKLERSIDSLARKLDRLDPKFSSSNRTGLNHWKDKPIIPLEEWIKFRYTPYALGYFPDDFDQILTYLLAEDDLEKGRERKDIEEWNSDYLELMENTKNPNYGKLKCFHCLLSPAGDDPIFIGINRLVSKGLIDRKQDPTLPIMIDAKVNLLSISCCVFCQYPICTFYSSCIHVWLK